MTKNEFLAKHPEWREATEKKEAEGFQLLGIELVNDDTAKITEFEINDNGIEGLSKDALTVADDTLRELTEAFRNRINGLKSQGIVTAEEIENGITYDTILLRIQERTKVRHSFKTPKEETQ